MKRICVVGTSGSGKTTFARRLAERLGHPHVELDALHWGPDWTPRPREEFRESVRRATAGETWVLDGNYSAVRDIVWGRATGLVWLDYTIGTVLWRLTTRTLRRTLGGETLWSGNRERLLTQFATRDSLYLWVFRTHWSRRVKYERILASGEFDGLTLVRLYSPADAAVWLQSLVRTDMAEVPEIVH